MLAIAISCCLHMRPIICWSCISTCWPSPCPGVSMYCQSSAGLAPLQVISNGKDMVPSLALPPAVKVVVISYDLAKNAAAGALPQFATVVCVRA